MRLFQVFPQPAAINLAGRTYLALPLRLRHLAQLETWLSSQYANPADELVEGVYQSEGRERRVRAAEVYTLLGGWPVELGSPQAEAKLLSPSGMRLMLGFMLDECNRIDESEYDHIIARLTPEDYKALIRYAYGVNLQEEMLRIVEPPMIFADAPKLSWSESVWKVIKETGWTFQEAGEMFLSQLTLVKSEGKAGSGELNYPTQKNVFDSAIEREAIFVEADERIAARKSEPRED